MAKASQIHKTRVSFMCNTCKLVSQIISDALGCSGWDKDAAKSGFSGGRNPAAPQDWSRYGAAEPGRPAALSAQETW